MRCQHCWWGLGPLFHGLVPAEFFKVLPQSESSEGVFTVILSAVHVEGEKFSLIFVAINSNQFIKYFNICMFPCGGAVWDNVLDAAVF